MHQATFAVLFHHRVLVKFEKPDMLVGYLPKTRWAYFLAGAIVYTTGMIVWYSKKGVIRGITVIAALKIVLDMVCLVRSINACMTHWCCEREQAM